MSGDGREPETVETDPVSAPLPAGHHETEPDHETEMSCGTDDDGPGWLHLLVADDAIAERHHMTLCGAVLARSELPSSLCADDCKRYHVYCQACIRDANKHNWNFGVDVDCPPGGDRADGPVSGVHGAALPPDADPGQQAGQDDDQPRGYFIGAGAGTGARSQSPGASVTASATSAPAGPPYPIFACPPVSCTRRT